MKTVPRVEDPIIVEILEKTGMRDVVSPLNTQLAKYNGL